MSIPKLCPYCQNNSTCRPSVPIEVHSHAEVESAVHDVSELEVALTGASDKKAFCSVVGNAIDEATQRGAARLVLVVGRDLSNADATLLASVINCRAILKTNHELSSSQCLQSIRIVCDSEQVEHVNKGLAKQHPLCLGCFEKHG